MTEGEWDRCSTPDTMLNYLTTLHALPSERKLRLFVCACVRRVWHLLDDKRSQRAIETAELYADGLVTRRKLDGAGRAARRAQSSVADAADAVGNAAELNLYHTVVVNQTHRMIFVTRAIEGAVAALSGMSVKKTRLEHKAQATLLRDTFGNPFRPVAFNPNWRTDTALALAQQMYDSRDFGAMPILADALQDAGCDNEDILNHCRDTNATHIRGCWVVDLVLGKA